MSEMSCTNIRGAGSSSINALYALMAALTQAQIEDLQVNQYQTSIKQTATDVALNTGVASAKCDAQSMRSRGIGGICKAGCSFLGGTAGLVCNGRSTGQLGEESDTYSKAETGFNKILAGKPSEDEPVEGEQNAIGGDNGLEVGETTEVEKESAAGASPIKDGPDDINAIDSKLRALERGNRSSMLDEHGNLLPEIADDFKILVKTGEGREMAREFMKQFSRDATVAREAVNIRRSSDQQYGQSISGFFNGSGDMSSNSADMTAATATGNSGIYRSISGVGQSLQNTSEQGEQKTSGKANAEQQQIEKVEQTIEGIIQADTARV